MDAIRRTQLIEGRERDLGGFSVRRVLPAIGRKMVGPFVFFDHMGPATFPAGQGLDVRPHPHIGLATVTYLFEGAIMHRDSLGSRQVIRPGDINWMTAGSGIVHSERSPEDMRRLGSRLEGIQTWIALPQEHEETSAQFSHHPAASLPRFERKGVNLQVLVGRAFDQQSPVKTFSDMLYVDAHWDRAGELELSAEGKRELGIYCVAGAVSIGGDAVPPGTLAIGDVGQDLRVVAHSAAHILIFGGEPLSEPREIWWNFVSSSKSRLEKAKTDWREGRFPKVPGDEEEFIPLPD